MSTLKPASRLSRRLATLLVAGSAIACTSAALAAEAGGVVDPARDKAAAAASQQFGLRSCRVVTVLASATPTGGTLTLELTPGVTSTFTLEPHSVRSSDFKLIVQDEKGEREVPAPMPTTYRGVNAQGDEAYVSVYQGRVEGRVIRALAPLNPLFIQPAPDADRRVAAANGGLDHAVYAASDVLPTDHHCGVDGCGACNSTARPRSASPGFGVRGAVPCRSIRLNVDCDYPMYAQSGFDVGAAVRNVESVMLGVNQVYFTATFNADPRHTITRITVRTSPTAEPYASIPLVGGDTGTLLTQVVSTWPAAAGRDLTHLFTGRDTGGNTIGLAYVGVVCSDFNSGLSEIFFSGNLASRQSLTAHEIGHNWDMSHDGASGFIMAPSLSSPPALTFSSESAGYINGYLATVPTCGTASLPDVQADGTSTLPGRAVRVDVLANDGRTGVACPTVVSSFTLPAMTTALGGTVGVSAGTGPGGRNEVLYTPPASVTGAANDTFNYTAAGATVPVTVSIAPPRPAETTRGADAGLSAVYYDTRPNLTPNSWWVWDVPPLDFSTYPVVGTTQTFTQLNFPGILPAPFARGMSAVITGWVRVPTSGYWTFTLQGGSSARLYLGGDAFIVASNSQPGVAVSATRALQAGLHPIRVDYHYGPNTPRLILSYNAEGQASAVVPATAFFRTALPACAADFDRSGTRTIDDIFVFLSAWFGGCTGQLGSPCNGLNSDIDNSGARTIDDIFIFLNLWFAGCP